MWTEKKKFPLVLAFLQVAFIVLFGVFGSYHESAHAQHGIVGDQHDELHPRYPMFQDVHIMIFIGFGFLMTFLKRYGFSAIGYNLLLSSVALQWTIIVQGLIRSGGKGLSIEISWLVEGDFGAAAVLITFGALLGKTSPLQIVVLTMFEIVFYAVNFHLGVEVLGAVDAGGSMMIHSFGAYFGLAAALVLKKGWQKEHQSASSEYHSDLFAMIGSLFLWICWPSFNGALVSVGNQQHRVIVNTYLSLAASTVSSFILSSLLSKKGKLDMVHIQNATLAGGVAVGTSADFMLNPVGALCVGTAAGCLSVVGYVYLSPLLERTIGLHDTCGVHNLHGMPGVLGGVAGIIAAAIANPDIYGNALLDVFPQRKVERTAEMNSSLVLIDQATSTGSVAMKSAAQQAGVQAAALGITLGMALVGGAITVHKEDGYEDDVWWDIPEEEEHDHHHTEMKTQQQYQGVPTAEPPVLKNVTKYT